MKKRRVNIKISYNDKRKLIKFKTHKQLNLALSIFNDT